MKIQKKLTNERVFEYDISAPFSAVTISKPQQKRTNQRALSEVRVTDTCTPVTALCMYMSTI
jgi:hypothetical protein